MTETFILSVKYLGTDHEFKARFERYGYTHRISVLIDEHTFTFEPDEGGDYRAVNNPENPVPENLISIPLLQAVAQKLANLNS
jgi:hypothetical protein